MNAKRDGEIALDFDPACLPGNGHVVFIGKVHSPWKNREDCPKNMGAARQRGEQARIEIEPAYRPGLNGLERFSHVIVLSWLDRADRNLIVQAPRHANEPRGTFALRSPVRPNPVGLHIACIVSVDAESGIITIDAIDVLDGTPIIDVKPYYPTNDAIDGATTG